MSNGFVCDSCQKFELEGIETEKVWVTKPFPLSASNYQIKLQNMLLATRICCHCSADVRYGKGKRSDILTKILVVSNKAAILDTECMELLFRGIFNVRNSNSTYYPLAPDGIDYNILRFQ